MNSVISQSQLFPIRTGVLSGGHAPAHWKREVACETDRLAMVLRTCGWIKGVIEIQPLLLEQPLLGNCLAEITSRDAPEPQVAATETTQIKRQFRQPAFGSRGRELIAGTASSASQRSRRQAAGVSEASGDHEFSRGTDQFDEARQSLSPGDRPASSRRYRQSGNASQLQTQGDGVFRLPAQVESVFRFPVQAGASLLKRLAALPVDVYKQPESPAKRFSSLRANRPASLSPVSSSSLQHQQDWRRVVSNRVTKTLLRDWSSSEGSALSADTPAKTSEPDVSAALLLEAQWATVPSGQRATAEILRRLAQRSNVPNVSEITRSRVDSPGNTNSLPTLSRSSAHAPATAKWTLRNEDLGTRPVEGILHGRDRSALEETDPASQFQFQPDAPGSERVRSSEHFAPPSLTPSLPQLLPPVGPGAASLPIAAEAARYSAWRDEVNAQEKDLSVLAAQVKQILDEEARRHGIDV